MWPEWKKLGVFFISHGVSWLNDYISSTVQTMKLLIVKHSSFHILIPLDLKIRLRFRSQILPARIPPLKQQTMFEAT